MSEPLAPASTRPKATLAFMGAVIAVIGGIVLATVGWYARVSTYAGEAKGPVVRVRFDTACAAEAEPVLVARLADYGMPAARIAGAELAFDVTLPGVMADESTHVPAALAAPGRLEVRVDGATRPVTIQNVGMQLAFSGTPVTLLMLAEDLPEQGVTAAIDGAEVDVEEVTGTELQLAARAGQSNEAIRLASDRAVQLRHPLPCAVVAQPAAGS